MQSREAPPFFYFVFVFNAIFVVLNCLAYMKVIPMDMKTVKKLDDYNHIIIATFLAYKFNPFTNSIFAFTRYDAYIIFSMSFYLVASTLTDYICPNNTCGF